MSLDVAPVVVSAKISSRAFNGLYIREFDVHLTEFLLYLELPHFNSIVAHPNHAVKTA